VSRYRLNPPSSADDDWLDVLRRAAYRELSNTTCGRRDDSRHPPHFSDTWEGGHFLVVEVGGNPIGIIQVSESRGSIEIAEIRIGADPGSCEPGAGGLREQIADARRFGKPVTLYLSPENSPARRLYERLGFTETGRSETEIIMERRHASIIDSHDAAIFDCDGVLVNSELIAQKIELELLESVGMNYPRDE